MGVVVSPNPQTVLVRRIPIRRVFVRVPVEPTITEALASDHAAVRQKIATMLARPALATRIYPLISADLKWHNRAEEATLYRALARFPSMRAQIATSETQHAHLDAMLRRLDVTPYNHPVWISRFSAARKALEDHLAVEETRVFSDARRLLPMPQQRLLGARYRRLMREQAAGSPGYG
jgi:hypothetical protein